MDGAEPGIILPAKPSVGMSYRQEYFKGEAEDPTEVLSLDELTEVPGGSYMHLLMTKEFTPLESDVLEHKFNARGVGPVLAISVTGGTAREELIELKRP